MKIKDKFNIQGKEIIEVCGVTKRMIVRFLEVHYIWRNANKNKQIFGFILVALKNSEKNNTQNDTQKNSYLKNGGKKPEQLSLTILKKEDKKKLTEFQYQKSASIQNIRGKMEDCAWRANNKLRSLLYANT